MEAVVLHVTNAKANVDVIRRGLNGIISDLDNAAIMAEGNGLDPSAFRQAADLFRGLSASVEEGVRIVDGGCEAVMESEQYARYHETMYGQPPTGVLI